MFLSLVLSEEMQLARYFRALLEVCASTGQEEDEEEAEEGRDAIEELPP